MSGGRPSRSHPAEGDHPPCKSNARKDGETAECARSTSEGLGLDGGGIAAPKQEEEEISLSGWHLIRAGDGSLQGETTGSVLDNSPRKGVQE